jgi:hypothetical protein
VTLVTLCDGYPHISSLLYGKNNILLKVYLYSIKICRNTCHEVSQLSLETIENPLSIWGGV